MNLREIGRFGKPHGINGEINAVTDVNLEMLHCIFVEIDGINVPFFIESVRPRGTEGVLLKIDGCTSDAQAKRLFANKPFSTEVSQLVAIPGYEDLEDEDPDGLYASDLIGFEAVETDGTPLGTIEDIDDNTANVLFIIRQPHSDRRLLVPVADELINEIDTDRQRIWLDLPAGIKDL